MAKCLSKSAGNNSEGIINDSSVNVLMGPHHVTFDGLMSKYKKKIVYGFRQETRNLFYVTGHQSRKFMLLDC